MIHCNCALLPTKRKDNTISEADDYGLKVSNGVLRDELRCVVGGFT